MRLAAPLPDDERLPVLRALDEVMSGIAGPLPPIRDLDGKPIEVRCRPPLALHELTAKGSNQEETEKTRLPPPAMHLLTQHTKHTLAHEIERYVEFTVETDNGIRSVALPPVFVEHYAAYRDSAVPRVGAIVTMPLVLPDGSLLAPDGLDRDRKLVFLIEPELAKIIPAPQDCGPEAIASALDYLTNVWLCDVKAASFADKCVMVAHALTIIQRVLFPERPGFFCTAGKRGGGKTTLLTMLVLVTTGKKPAAAAWSASADERRKAMLAILAEGVAAVVWDNIALGTTISCPTLEKVLTADSYSDRVLGETANLTVPAYTVMSFSGNNIGPRGELASRVLMERIEVDRPDPENRPFKHPDPIAWTLDNRGEILACLYTLLLGNPHLRAEPREPAQTRFKVWWDLVGSAVEHAAAELVDRQSAFPPEWRNAEPVSFQALFAAVEGEDEDSAGLAAVLDVLNTVWPDGKNFQASDVAKRITEPMDGEGAHALALRPHFETPNWRGAGALTARSVGKRLAAMVDAPVMVGDQVMKLVRTVEPTEKNKRASWFKVRVS